MARQFIDRRGSDLHEAFGVPYNFDEASSRFELKEVQ